MKIGSLCTGYGGLDMAVESYFNAEMVWCAENDKYASKVITERFNKPNLGDIKQINWASVEPIDILTAGYPCQPFSTAGQRKGVNDERHIWPYINEAISVLRPRYIILENVRGHLTLGFKEVLSDLAKNGYDARWQIVRASDVGAPHQRARLFIIAYPKGGWTGSESSGVSQSNPGTCCNSQSTTNSSGKGLQGTWHKTNDLTNGVITNTNDARRIGHLSGLSKRFNSSDEMQLQTIPPTLAEGKLNAKFVEYMMGLPNGWVTDLDLSRSQQLKILGNGVVPQQAYYALELLHGIRL